MNVEGLADKIYEDVKQNVIDWSTENGKVSYSPSGGGYVAYEVEPREYMSDLVNKLADELLDRLADDGELNEGFYESF